MSSKPEDYEIDVTVRLTVPFNSNTCFADPSDIARDVARVLYSETGVIATSAAFDGKVPVWLSECTWGRIVGFTTRENKR